MNKLFVYIVFFFGFFSGSCQDTGKLVVLADMPSSLEENSGLAYFNKNHVWVVEDSGNDNDLYAVNFKGKVIKVFDVKDVKNQDWEDLAADKSNNLYIGDFGDNSRSREDLVIYKLPNPEIEKGEKIKAKRIEFSYVDNINYNTEAFFHWKKALYLVTKDEDRYSGVAKIFKLPDTEGKHKASYIGELKTCNDYSYCAITSADISEDGEKIVLLSNGMIWIITNFSWDNFSEGKISKHDLGVRTQLESVCFLNDSTLLLSDEKSHSQGGNLYMLDLTDL